MAKLWEIEERKVARTLTKLGRWADSGNGAAKSVGGRGARRVARPRMRACVRRREQTKEERWAKRQARAHSNSGW